MTHAHLMAGTHLGQRGFTLIEVLIAALVLSLGLLGLAGLHAVSLKMSHGSYLRTQATNLAYEITDAMRANRLNATDYNGSDIDCDWDPSDTSVKDSDLAGWSNHLCTLPSGRGVISVVTTGTRIEATVTLTWDETRQEGTTSTESFSFETLL